MPGEIVDYDPIAGSFTRRDLPAGSDVPARILGALPPGDATAPPVPLVGGAGDVVRDGGAPAFACAAVTTVAR